MRWIWGIVGPLVIVAMLAAGAYLFFTRDRKAAVTAGQQAGQARTEAGHAEAALDARDITDRGQIRERVIIQTKERAIASVQAAQGADAPLSADLVRRIDLGMHDIDSHPECGRQLPVLRSGAGGVQQARPGC